MIFLAGTNHFICQYFVTYIAITKVDGFHSRYIDIGFEYPVHRDINGVNELEDNVLKQKTENLH